MIRKHGSIFTNCSCNNTTRRFARRPAPTTRRRRSYRPWSASWIKAFGRPRGSGSSRSRGWKCHTWPTPPSGPERFYSGVLRRIADTVEADEGAGARPAAIVAALKRLVGFEVQFGPFAVAQLRLFAEFVDLTTPAAIGNGRRMKPRR